MKQIEYYIESNKKLLDYISKLFYDTPREDESERNRLKEWKREVEVYLQGLQDAKRYIEEERGK